MPIHVVLSLRTGAPTRLPFHHQSHSYLRVYTRTNHRVLQADETLATFMDYCTYGHMIDNVVLIVTGTLHERDVQVRSSANSSSSSWCAAARLAIMNRVWVRGRRRWSSGSSVTARVLG